MTTVIGADLEEIKDRAMERVVRKVERRLMSKKYRRLGRLFNRPLPNAVTEALDNLEDEVEAATTVQEIRSVVQAFVDRHNLA